MCYLRLRRIMPELTDEDASTQEFQDGYILLAK